MPSRREQLEKQPIEQYPVDINFSTVVPLGAYEISSAIAFAVKWPRRRPNERSPATSEILLSDTPILVTNCKGPKLLTRLFLRGGQDNYDYQITVRATFDTGSVLEEELFVRVRDR